MPPSLNHLVPKFKITCRPVQSSCGRRRDRSNPVGKHSLLRGGSSRGGNGGVSRTCCTLGRPSRAHIYMFLAAHTRLGYSHRCREAPDNSVRTNRTSSGPTTSSCVADTGNCRNPTCVCPSRADRKLSESAEKGGEFWRKLFAVIGDMF